MSEQTALQKARSILGSLAAFSAAAKVRSPTAHEWFRRGQTPADRCGLIETATSGAVTCEELRPDLNWQRDPETGAVVGYLVPLIAQPIEPATTPAEAA